MDQRVCRGYWPSLQSHNKRHLQVPHIIIPSVYRVSPIDISAREASYRLYRNYTVTRLIDSILCRLLGVPLLSITLTLTLTRSQVALSD